MEITSLATAETFTTKDGSTIRELHHTAEQSLAEASLPSGARTGRHYLRFLCCCSPPYSHDDTYFD